ncbi:MAG: MazG protein [Bacteroidota bacterium]|jgi:XTP/dITP diphosphohydrolase
MNYTDPRLESFGRLLKIMDELREQCPWDKKQTIESLRHLSIEEVYELSDAILDQQPEALKKELGDVLLHIVFYSRIASEKNWFNIQDVIEALCKKLIERHPHIYGTVDGELKQVNNEEDVKQNWEKLKLREGNRSALSGVPNSLPALIKAYRMQEKASGVGFDWEKPEQVWEKVEEELRELRQEVEQGSEQERIAKELGDVFFSLVNYARLIGVNPEDALEYTNRKFVFRFRYLEDKVRESGRQLSDLNLEQMDLFWNEAKKLKGGI